MNRIDYDSAKNTKSTSKQPPKEVPKIRSQKIEDIFKDYPSSELFIRY